MANNYEIQWKIVCHACSLMRFWAGLYAGEEKEVLIEGVNAMLQIAVKLLAKKNQKTGDIKRLPDSEQGGDRDPESSK